MPIKIRRAEVMTAFVFFFIGVCSTQLFEESSKLKENRKATLEIVNHCRSTLQASYDLTGNFSTAYVTVGKCFAKGRECDLKGLWKNITILDEENIVLRERLDAEKVALDRYINPSKK